MRVPENSKKVWRKMIVKGKYNYKYSTVNFKASVAKRFRLFSKKIAKSHSKTLTVIMDFFEWHGFLPSDRFERSIVQEIVKNRKRTEASIAIIKSIEKEQTKPTNAMLLSLFEEKVMEEEPMLVEKKFMDPILITEDEELTYYRDQYYKMKKEHNGFKFEVRKIINKITLEKRTLGKDYFKLNTTEKDFEKFRNENNI
ncbi:BfmA/BtgA family mobilization protein [Aureibaculum conchae]|uniref:BfmA/BtgA family mobilization protein n=1 Tax=Aureibaculum sp. 2308TA14-22 TaxID=3108392 RepID=UPI00339AA1DB